jgi:hypothetical protein
MNLRETLRSFLPDELQVDPDLALPLQWIDDDLDIQSKVYPQGRFRILTGSPTLPGRRGGTHDRSTRIADEEHMAIGDQVAYRVDRPDIVFLHSVTGTIGGLPHTFTQATIEARDGYMRPSHLVFHEDEMPDPGTPFLVTYTHLLLQEMKNMALSLPIQFTVRATKYTDGDTHYEAPEMAERMAFSLFAFLGANRGKVLEGGPRTNRVTLGPPTMMNPAVSSILGESVCGWTVSGSVLIWVYAPTSDIIPAINRVDTSMVPEQP